MGAERYTARLISPDNTYVSHTVTDTLVTFTDLTTDLTYILKVRTLGLGNDYSEESEGLEVSTDRSVPDVEVDPTENMDEEEKASAEELYAQFLIPEEEESLGVLAFPGAQGGGMYTTGGRGGKVYHVTTLEDNVSDHGSLRYLLHNLSDTRIIVFDVCGTIELNSDLQINNGNVTVLGQTAPGDGVCIAGHTIQVAADNIVIRFLRFRCGDESTGLSDGSDCIWGRYNSDIILDHCTMSWSIDELGSFYANKNFTMQWCMLAEALNNSGYHSKSGHGYAGIWGGRNASFHHNLMANNYSRNARIDHPGVYGNYLETHRGNVDYRNNVIYNWCDNSTYGGEDGWFNIIGNYYKPGPASKTRAYYVDAYWYNSSSSHLSSAYPELYLEGNYHTGGISSSYADGVMWHDQKSYSSDGTNPSHTVLSEPLSIKCNDVSSTYVTTHSATDAFAQVLDYVGCSLSRDSFDERIAAEAYSGTSTYGDNGILDHIADAGGLPSLSATDEQIAAQASDTDEDGIPDWFEELFGLDPEVDDASEITLDIHGRYTNFEMYAHYLVKDIIAVQNTNGTYSALD